MKNGERKRERGPSPARRPPHTHTPRARARTHVYAQQAFCVASAHNPLRGVPWPPVPARGKSGGAEACPARGSVLAVPVHVRPHRCVCCRHAPTRASAQRSRHAHPPAPRAICCNGKVRKQPGMSRAPSPLAPPPTPTPTRAAPFASVSLTLTLSVSLALSLSSDHPRRLSATSRACASGACVGTLTACSSMRRRRQQRRWHWRRPVTPAHHGQPHSLPAVLAAPRVRAGGRRSAPPRPARAAGPPGAAGAVATLRRGPPGRLSRGKCVAAARRHGRRPRLPPLRKPT